MSDGDIYSNVEKYRGFGAMMANVLRHREERATSARCAVAVASAVPAPAKATVAPSGASGTKKSPPVAVAECIWLTKRPYKRQKKTLQPPGAPATTAAPAPSSLVGVDGAAVRTPAEKKPTTVLPPVPAAALVPLSFDKPIHPCGILVKIVGTTVSCQGRSCKEHEICG
jgi:hypothetical protein